MYLDKKSSNTVNAKGSILSQRNSKQDVPWYSMFFCQCLKDECEDSKFRESDNSSVVLDSDGQHYSQAFFDSDLHQVQQQPILKPQRRTQKQCKVKTLIAGINESQEGNVTFQISKNEQFFCILFNTEKKFHILNFDVTNISQKQFPKYIAQRCKSEAVIIDAFAENGQYSMQFENECQFVLSIVKQDEQITQENFETQRWQENVQLIKGDYTDLRDEKLFADLIFLNLTSQRYNQIQLQQLVKKSLKIGKSLVVLVQQSFNIQTFIDAIYSIGQDDAQFMQIKSISFECEQIIINEKPLYKVLYYGTIAKISHRDELLLLGNSLLYDGSEFRGLDLNYSIYEILDKLISITSIFQVTQAVVECIQNISYPNLIISDFLEWVIESNLLSFEEIEEINKIHCQTKCFRTHSRHPLTNTMFSNEKLSCLHCNLNKNSYQKATHDERGFSKLNADDTSLSLSYPQIKAFHCNKEQQKIGSSEDSYNFSIEVDQTSRVLDSNYVDSMNSHFLTPLDRLVKQMTKTN